MHHEPALAYLIADGGRARLVLRHGDGHFDPLASFSGEPAHRPSQDTRGRTEASVGTARSAIEEPDTTAVRRRFAAELSDALEGFIARGAFKRLVLIAPARMLADIRQGLSEAAARVIAGELAKDLTKLPEAKLRPILDGLALRPLQ